MAVTLVTPTLAGSGVTMSIVQCGEAASVCMPMYLTSDGKYDKASNGSAAVAKVAGLVGMTVSGDEIYTPLIKSGPVNIASGTLTIGTTYYLGSTAGQIVAWADLSSGDYITVIGTAFTTSAIDVAIYASGETV